MELQISFDAHTDSLMASIILLNALRWDVFDNYEGHYPETDKQVEKAQKGLVMAMEALLEIWKEKNIHRMVGVVDSELSIIDQISMDEQEHVFATS